MKNNYLIIGTIVVIVVVFGAVYILNNSAPNNSNDNKYQTGDNNTGKDVGDVIDSRIEKNQDVQLPEKYQDCKNQPGLTDCMASSGEGLNSDNYKKVFKDILQYEDRIETTGENVEATLATRYSMLFNTDPSQVLEPISSEDEKLRSVLIKGKKRLVEKYVNRGNVSKGDCKQIPEKEVKSFCKNLFE